MNFLEMRKRVNLIESIEKELEMLERIQRVEDICLSIDRNESPYLDSKKLVWFMDKMRPLAFEEIQTRKKILRANIADLEKEIGE